MSQIIDYSEEVMEHFTNPRNVGEIENASGVGTVGTSSMATEMIKGKSIQEALKLTNKAVMEALGGLPPVKVHCSLLAEEAVHAALWDYAQKHNITIEGLKPPVNDIDETEAFYEMPGAND